MSTKGNKNEEELKLDSRIADSYSPEIETSIWYN